MKQGIVVKCLGGFCFVVEGNNPDHQSRPVRCLTRGRVKKLEGAIYAGDKVIYEIGPSGEGVIEEVLPRDNRLIRPPVANVTHVLVVTASTHPEPDFGLIDRILVSAAKERIPASLCVNKIDLSGFEVPAHIRDPYEAAGYEVLGTSARTGCGIDRLRESLKGHISVMAGASGVGKSALLNALNPNLNRESGEISAKAGRGRHTTRHVELIPIGEESDGLIADTPGFSRLELQELEPEELQGFYGEFREFEAGCRYQGCLHYKEPDCAVIEAVEAGRIDAGRYNRYLALLDETIRLKARRYR